MPTAHLDMAQMRAARKSPGPRCSLGAFLTGLPPMELKTFREVFADESISGRVVFNALVSIGYSSRWYRVVDSHRRRECSRCFVPGGVLA